MQNPLARLRFALDHRWSQRGMSGYIDGEMGPVAAGRLERHARDCPECRELLATLETMIATLAALPGRPAESVAPAVLRGVHERLAADGDDGA